jgi:hypothetical protein
MMIDFTDVINFVEITLSPGWNRDFRRSDLIDCLKPNQNDLAWLAYFIRPLSLGAFRSFSLRWRRW